VSGTIGPAAGRSAGNVTGLAVEVLGVVSVEAWMKTTLGVIGLLILVALGWIAWPYYAVYDFANAIQQGDQVVLERRVAWDSVRGGLREDLSAVFARSTQGVGLAALVGPAIINNAIDYFVTPQGIASLLRIAKAPIPNADQRPSSPIDDKQRDSLQLEQVKYAFFSGGPLTFRVDIATDNAKSAQQPVTTLLFKWAGDWKLSRLVLPLDAIQNIAGGRRQ
jgi:hypothetical protein